jgi:hypothetical protein
MFVFMLIGAINLSFKKKIGHGKSFVPGGVVNFQRILGSFPITPYNLYHKTHVSTATQTNDTKSR